MRSFVETLLSHPSVRPFVAHERFVEGRDATFAELARPLPRAIQGALESSGIQRLYSHQVAAIDAARSGANVLAVTPTASGKTLIFALPVLETALDDPRSHALFLYPTKALAQDQSASLRRLAAETGGLRPPRFEIYDGDTPDALRRRIRAEPPEALLTNPDMLHLGILAHHRDWEPFLRGLRWVVLDELHVYRGIFGAHVHHILARLRRLCAAHGAHPRFLAASATIGNPAAFAELLVGEPFHVVEESGAPRAGRHVVMLNPVAVSPYTLAVRVVAAAMRAGLRTIAFTKARRITELLHTWLAREAPELAGRVAPYRAGYLPQERRDIEARLFRGDLLGVLSTSALELGIDVGDLDVCVLVGYPGSMTSTWQRIGRVGRKKDAIVVMIAFPDALDQYVVAHPDHFFGKGFERAVLDPDNPVIAGQHLVCAAAEEPIRATEIEEGSPRSELLASLEAEGRVRRDAEGARWFSFRRNPHRDVTPRSAARPFTIQDVRSGRTIGSIDGARVFHECHPGAIYLHAGQSYRVRKLDVDARRVEAETFRPDYYTVVLGEKETEILERLEERRVQSVAGTLGRLKVTVRIREYEKRRLFDAEPISSHPLDVPPLVFETIGFWIEPPPGLARVCADKEMHFMGGLHACEHAMIGLFPLLAIADRGDVGGISYTCHPQLGRPAIFLYDGVVGGAGLAEHGFRELAHLLRSTADHVAACPCDQGCPSCIHSPRCGNGNKPLDKAAALLTLSVLLGDALPEGMSPEDPRSADGPVPLAPPPRRRRKHGITRAIAVGPPRPSTATGEWETEPEAEAAPIAAAVFSPERDDTVLILDIETQRSAEEVGGWQNTHRMGVALAVVYDVRRRSFATYREDEVHRLLLDLVMADRVVGFNIDRFDLRVLAGYTDWSLSRIRTLDLHADIFRRLGFRLSLGHLAEANLGESKRADGLQSLRWWREGRMDLIESYCRSDVDLTRRLYDLGAERRYLLYRDREGNRFRLPVSW
jgi:DEAD/DEAH box helicase domain-containing protein